MTTDTKLLLPIILGVSVFSTSAFLIYYLLKKDDEDDERSQITSDKSTARSTIEVVVSKDVVPSIIGRGGSNIKEIETKSGANVKFKKDVAENGERICLITGSVQATQLAETLIQEHISNRPVIEEDTMEVPQWACGRIIGSGGSNISNTSLVSGAKINLDRGSYGDHLSPKIVTIKGSKKQIQTAKEMIEKCVAQEKNQRESESWKRTPRGPQAEYPDGTTEHPGDVSICAGVKHDAPVAIASSGVAGALLEVYVSAVSSPSRFWVQIVGRQVAQLDELVDQMSHYYGKQDNRKLHELDSVQVGQIVAAVFRHDGKWYRAKVMEIKQNEFDASQRVADVLFVDYGDSEYVAVHELHQLRPDFLRLRFQALECFLADVAPAGLPEETQRVSPSGEKWEHWNPRAVQRFEELTHVARWKSLTSRTCSFRERAGASPVPGIQLTHISNGVEVDVGLMLIREGWAVEAPPPSAAPTPATTPTFGDLGTSKVLSMLGDIAETGRSSQHNTDTLQTHYGSQHSLDTSQPYHATITEDAFLKKQADSFKPHGAQNGHSNISTVLIHTEREDRAEQSPGPTTHADPSQTGQTQSGQSQSGQSQPVHIHRAVDELKANMNRIDSHQGSLEALGRQSPLHT